MTWGPGPRAPRAAAGLRTPCRVPAAQNVDEAGATPVASSSTPFPSGQAPAPGHAALPLGNTGGAGASTPPVPPALPDELAVFDDGSLIVCSQVRAIAPLAGDRSRVYLRGGTPDEPHRFVDVAAPMAAVTARLAGVA